MVVQLILGSRVAVVLLTVMVLSGCRRRSEPAPAREERSKPTAVGIAKEHADKLCGSCHWPSSSAAPVDAGAAPSHEEDQDSLAARSVHIPTREELAAMPVAGIVLALERGTMRGIATAMTPEQRIAIAEYLTGATYDPTGPTAHYCPSSPRDLTKELDGPSWTGWGVDLGNTRFQSAANAKLTAADVPKLEPKWSFALAPGRAGSVVVAHGSRLFFGDQAGKVRAVDRHTGCTYWVVDAGRWVRTVVNLFGVEAGKPRACFGATQFPDAYWCVDAGTGERIWEADLVDHPMSYVSTGAALHEGMLYVPLSAGRESHRAAADPKYECCTGRGALVAVEAETGKVKWRTYMTPEPEATQKSSVGTQLRGPSGASVWKAPAVDPVLGRIYVATGQNSSLPATTTSSAVVAVDAKSGEIVWSYQFRKQDIWNGGCNAPKGRGAQENCPFVTQGGMDVSTPLLTERPGGGRMLVVADKSGRVVALDPDKQGAVLWQQKVSSGGFWGGVQWGMATDGEKLYVPIHDRFGFGEPALGTVMPGKKDPDAGALVALRLDDGKELWRARPPGNTCEGKQRCAKAFSTAPAVIPGVVFASSLDGHVRAFSTEDGKILWDYDTTQEFTTVDGSKVKGGSIDGPGGVIVVDGSVIITSGYGAYFSMPGNVLLTFTVGGK